MFVHCRLLTELCGDDQKNHRYLVTQLCAKVRCESKVLVQCFFPPTQRQQYDQCQPPVSVKCQCAKFVHNSTLITIITFDKYVN